MCKECKQLFRLQAELKKHLKDFHPRVDSNRVLNQENAAVEKPGNVDMGFLNGGCVNFYVSPLLKKPKARRYQSPNQLPEGQDFKEEREEQKSSGVSGLDIDHESRLRNELNLAPVVGAGIVDNSAPICCLICTEEIEEQEEKFAREILPCHHSVIIHDECLFKHLQVSTRCPVLIQLDGVDNQADRPCPEDMLSVGALRIDEQVRRQCMSVEEEDNSSIPFIAQLYVTELVAREGRLLGSNHQVVDEFFDDVRVEQLKNSFFCVRNMLSQQRSAFAGRGGYASVVDDFEASQQIIFINYLMDTYERLKELVASVRIPLSDVNNVHVVLSEQVIVQEQINIAGVVPPVEEVLRVPVVVPSVLPIVGDKVQEQPKVVVVELPEVEDVSVPRVVMCVLPIVGDMIQVQINVVAEQLAEEVVLGPPEAPSVPNRPVVGAKVVYDHTKSLPFACTFDQCTARTKTAKLLEAHVKLRHSVNAVLPVGLVNGALALEIAVPVGVPVANAVPNAQSSVGSVSDGWTEVVRGSRGGRARQGTIPSRFVQNSPAVLPLGRGPGPFVHGSRVGNFAVPPRTRVIPAARVAVQAVLPEQVIPVGGVAIAAVAAVVGDEVAVAAKEKSAVVVQKNSKKKSNASGGREGVASNVRARGGFAASFGGRGRGTGRGGFGRPSFAPRVAKSAVGDVPVANSANARAKRVVVEIVGNKVSEDKDNAQRASGNARIRPNCDYDKLPTRLPTPIELAKGSVIRYIPRHVLGAVIATIKVQLSNLRYAIEAKNEKEIVTHFVRFLQVIKVMCMRPKRNVDCKTKSLNKSIQALVKQLRDDPDAFWKENALRPVDNSQVASVVLEAEVDVISAKIINQAKKAIRLNKQVSEGFIKKASQSLSQFGIAEINPGVIEKLRALHPEVKHGVDMKEAEILEIYGPDLSVENNGEVNVMLDPAEVANFADTHTPAIDLPLLTKIFSQMDNGSSAGYSGTTGQIMKLLSEDKASMFCFYLLSDLQLNNNVPLPLHEYLKSGLLVSANKEDREAADFKDSGVIKIRPLTTIEFVSRGIDKYVNFVLAREIAGDFLPVQMGIGVPGGSEVAIHTLQVGVEVGVAQDEDHIVIKNDTENAYNSLMREGLFRAINANKHAVKYASYFHFLYDKPSNLFVKDGDEVVETVVSAEGMYQGRQTSTTGFCLAVQPILLKVQKDHPGVRIISIHDDVHVSGSVTLAIAANLQLEELLLKYLGLRFSPGKGSVLWTKSDTAPPAVVDYCRDRHFKVCIGAMSTLGGVIGVPVDGVDHRIPIIKKVLEENMKSFDTLLRKEVTCQSFLLMLRESIALKANYLIRCVSPVIMAELLVNYQLKLMRLIKVKLKLPDFLTALMCKQFCFPLRLSGLGLRILGAVESLAIPFLASVALAIPFCGVQLRLYPELPMVIQIKTAIAWIRAQVVPNIASQEKLEEFNNVVPDNYLSFLDSCKDGAPNKLQKLITEIVENAMFNEIISSDTLSDCDKARMLDLSSQYASTWLLTYPSSSIFALSDEEFCLSIRLFLGLPPMDVMPYCCHKCGALFSEEPWHALVCKFGRKTGMYFRHQLGVHMLVDACNSVGIYASHKANVYGDGHYLPGANPDVLIQLPDKGYVVDNTHRHTTAKTYIADKSALTRGKVLHDAQNYKIHHHEQLAAEAGLGFFPLAVSTYGAFGTQAIELFDLLNRAEASRICYDNDDLVLKRPSFFAKIIRVMSIASWKGNARLVFTECGAARVQQRTNYPLGLACVAD